MRIIGHRGARGLAPENTLQGLNVAIQLGTPWLEFDVQLHPSGELVLLHDLSLDRTTNASGLLSDLGWPAVRLLDAGGGQQLPTLDEALDLIDQRAGVNIELKTWDGTAAAVATVVGARLQAGWSPSQFQVSSFHLPELFEFHLRMPSVPLGVLLCGVPLDWAACATQLKASSLNISSEFVDAQLLADAKKRGLAVYVYTVNDIDECRRLAAMGVDGVFTDFPDRLLAAD